MELLENVIVTHISFNKKKRHNSNAKSFILTLVTFIIQKREYNKHLFLMKRISRAKFENLAYLLLNVANITLYIMVLSGSILKASGGSLADIIQSIYCM